MINRYFMLFFYDTVFLFFFFPFHFFYLMVRVFPINLLGISKMKGIIVV